MRLVLASNNAHKLDELRALLAPTGIELIAQGALQIPEADEPFATFLENALVKARHAARAANGPAIADDSGLCVDALQGRPGVDSAVFAGVVASTSNDRETRRQEQDRANNALLLQRLLGASDRRARFVCTLVALRHADDPEPLIATGRWELEVLDTPRGAHGFGYDPLAYVRELEASVAELPADVKNQHSHRARAARQMSALMHDAWRLG